MKILNLTNESQSQILYKITRFPDGQQDVLITTNNVSYVTAGPVTIKSRFNSFRDLELIICSTKALRRLGVKEIHLYIPYLLGARSDRQFQEGGTSYLVDIIAPLINAQNFESVTTIDPHSDVASACISNLKTINNVMLVRDAFTLENRECVLVSPDAGALKKIYNIAKATSYNGDIITASKHREIETGKILSTEVPMNEGYLHLYKHKDFIIIDDICDGGRTFIELSKAIKEKMTSHKGKIYLIVTHGIFSAGLKELCEHFDGIHTTNSIMDISSLSEFGMRNEKYLEKVKQLNVF